MLNEQGELIFKLTEHLYWLSFVFKQFLCCEIWMWQKKKYLIDPKPKFVNKQMLVLILNNEHEKESFSTWTKKKPPKNPATFYLVLWHISCWLFAKILKPFSQFETFSVQTSRNQNNDKRRHEEFSCALECLLSFF